MITILLVVLGVCATAFYLIKDAGYESCVLSFEDKVNIVLQTSDLRGKIPITNQWRTLDVAEERLVLDVLKNRNATFDCYQYSEISTFDAFAGESGWIEVMKTPDSTAVRVEFKYGRSRITPKRSPR